MAGPHESAVTSHVPAEPVEGLIERSHSKLTERLFAVGIGALIALGVAARVVIWFSPWGFRTQTRPRAA